MVEIKNIFNFKNLALKQVVSSLFLLITLFCVFLIGGVNAFAQDGCNVDKSEIRWYSIATPANFLPIIPIDCATKDGVAQPLSPRIIPEIIIRLFGFMISLVWLLLLPTVIFAGIWYIWGGFDGTSSEAAKRLLQNSLLSLLSLFFFFISVFAFLGLFGAGDLVSTDISTLFN